MINVTQVATYTPEQFIKYAHDLVAWPSLLILFFAIHAVYGMLGLILVENKKKYFTIWGLSLLFTSMILIILLYLPNTTQSVVEAINNFLS